MCTMGGRTNGGVGVLGNMAFVYSAQYSKRFKISVIFCMYQVPYSIWYTIPT